MHVSSYDILFMQLVLSHSIKGTLFDDIQQLGMYVAS